MNEMVAKQKVVDAGIRLVESGLIARTWGNVSCRISDTHFVITPSGRDYLSLTPDEIVPVAIADLSYEGTIKPSGEKGIHAEIYAHCPDVNFVIHTHQENASVISAMGLGSIPADAAHPLLGGEVICTPYALPGTKKIRQGVAAALTRANGKALILRNHGAVCFGTDEEETFRVATALEEACLEAIAEQYKSKSGKVEFNAEQMRQFVLAQIAEPWESNGVDFTRPYCNSKRTDEGFLLHLENNKSVPVKLGHLTGDLPKEAEIHQNIYLKNKEINCILHVDSPNILTISQANITLYPLVDDFAQIIGTKVVTVTKDPRHIAALLQHTSAVFLGNHGALCCGANEADASAVQMILEKCSKAQLCGALFGVVKPLSWRDSKLMRFVYLKKYSKQISQEVSK